jgi:general secretion pathway protein H
MMRTGSKGFTLLELVIVLIIISLLVLLITPNLTRTLSHMEAKGAAKRIAAILRYSRSDAINKGRVNLVSFDTSSNVVSVSSVDEEEGEPKAQRFYPLPEGVKMEKIDVGKTLFDSSVPTIEFYRNGGSNGGTASIQGEKGQPYSVRVEMLTGGVKVETPEEK